MSNLEQRVLKFDLHLKREGSVDSVPHLQGMAVVYNEEIEIGKHFREKISPGSLTESIANDDIVATFNHSMDNLLGRVSNETLKFSDGEEGLSVDILPNMQTEIGQRVVAYVSRGDVAGMSFMFEVQQEEVTHPKTKGELPLYTIKKAKVYEMGPVTMPAYNSTSVKVASQRMLQHERWLKEKEAFEERINKFEQSIG